MEIKNLVTQRVFAFLGQCSALTHVMPDATECVRLENFVSRNSRLRKIWGATRYYEAGFGAGEIKWIDYFRNRWFFQRGNLVGVETAENSQNFLEFGEIYGGAASRIFSDRWRDNLYMSNGFENKAFQSNVLGEQFLNVGLFPPGLGKRVASALAPCAVLSEVTAPAYQLTGIPAGPYGAYLITWWDENRQVESMPSQSFVGEDGLWQSFPRPAPRFAPFVITLAGVNTAVKVDITALKALGYDPRVTHFIVYRATASDPTVFKRVNDPTSSVGTIPTPITSDFYVDATPEANLGQVLDTSLSPPPSGRYYHGAGNNDDVGNYGPRFVKFHRDQLWYFGVRFPGAANGGKIVASNPYSDAFTEDFLLEEQNYFPVDGIAYGSEVGNFDYCKYTYDVGRSTGQRDTFMGKNSNTLMFFKEESTYYLDGTSPDNYEVRELDNKRGIVASGSAQETSVGIIGLGKEGFTLFDGVSKGKIISEKIQDMVEQINFDYVDKITSAWDPKEEKYECHCPFLLPYNTIVFLYDVKTKSWSFTKRAGGAAGYGLASNRRVVGLLGDKQNGRLYKTTDRSAVTFDGQTMHGLWRKMFDFGQPNETKSVQMVTIVARARRDFQLSVDLIPDFAQKDAVSVNNVDPDVRGDQWASGADDEEGMDWDEGQWASGTEKKEFTILIQAIGKKLELVIRNSDTDADSALFEIEEVTLWASLVGGEENA